MILKLKKPRWVLGQSSGFQVGKNISIDLNEFQGYGRSDGAQTVSSILAGKMVLTLNSTTFDLSQDGIMTLDINYQGTQGGNWQRNNVSITNITQPH